MPAGDVAVAVVAEIDDARIGHHGKRPVAFHGLAELRFERHQREEALHGGIAVHLVVARKIPESVVLLLPVVVDDSPAESYLLVLVKAALDGF